MSTTSPVSTAEQPETTTAAPARGPGGITPLVLRLHFYAGVLVAPFLVVAVLTGLGFVLTPQLDELVYADELRVAEVGDTRQPLAEQVAAARTAHPAGDITSVVPPDTADATTRVVVTVPGLGEKQHTVYVDPYTNQVRGVLTTWFGETPLTTWLDDLHRNLHAGDVGRMYSELAASWLWVIALGGLVLWLGRQRRTRNRLRRTVLPDLSARGVRRTRGWHASSGVWLLTGLLILSATGLTWSRYAGGHFSSALDLLDAGRPALTTAAAGGSGGHHGDSATTSTPAADPAAVDRVVAVARDHGLTGPIDVALPAEPGAVWTVTQTDNTWPVRLDRVAVDPATGTVVDRSDFADWPLLAQLSKLGVQAHMGYLFGPVNQVLLAALAIGLLCVTFWGYRMWWQRRPTRSDRRAPVGTPPARGAWQRLPAGAIAVGAPLVVLVGWALPALGVSLLGFLAIDLIGGRLLRS